MYKHVDVMLLICRCSVPSFETIFFINYKKDMTFNGAFHVCGELQISEDITNFLKNI